MKTIRILIGGSPCTHWSIAQGKNRETAASGIGWELFRNYLIAREKFNPHYFLYENNKSASEPIKRQIAKELNVWDGTMLMPYNDNRFTYINSALVSAQNRERFYVTGGMGDISQPEDRGILLKDVLDGGYAYEEKGYPLKASTGGGVFDHDFLKSNRSFVAMPANASASGKARTLDAHYANAETKAWYRRVYSKNKNKQQHDYVAVPVQVGEIADGGKYRNGKQASQQSRVYSPYGKSVCIDTDSRKFVAAPVSVAQRGRYTATKNRSKKVAGATEQCYEARTDYKANALTTVSKDSMVAEPVRIGTIESGGNPKHNSKQYRVYSPNGKATTPCGEGGGMGAKTGLYATPINATTDGKACTIKAQYQQTGPANLLKGGTHFPASGVAESVPDGLTVDGKKIYQVLNGQIKINGELYPIKLPDGFYIIRKLTVAECRRLQTIPDWYVFPVSNTQAYRMLGNGWTVEVIKHILRHIPEIKNGEDCEFEVLSMYDGMACGAIALMELGVKIKRYVAYEIDKFAIQTACVNFPFIEQRGDAFAVRDAEWKY